MMASEDPPRAFVSYAWTSPAHKQKVLELAEKLRADGIDVRLDRWHLREGHDANVFMESMIADPKITKVILIFDRLYAERADGRAGGVGKETQIVTSEIYQNAQQDKFVGVTFELGPDSKAYKPIYYGERIYIDFCSEDVLEGSYERLLRWLHGQPADVPPPVGRKPVYLEKGVSIPHTAMAAHRVIRDMRTLAPNLSQTFASYLDKLLEEIATFKFPLGSSEEYIEFFSKTIETFVPIRSEWVDISNSISRSEVTERQSDQYISFFEGLLELTEPEEHLSSHLVIQFDHFKFIARELFLILIATFIEKKVFSAAQIMLEAGYFSEAKSRRNRLTTLISYEVFDDEVRTMEALNQKSSQRFYSMHGKIVHDRAQTPGVRFSSLLQADFVLYLRSQWRRINKVPQQTLWYPVLYPYAERLFCPLELFARSESTAYFDRVKGLIGVASASDFRKLIEYIEENSSRGERVVDIKVLTGIDKIATR